MAWFYYVEHPKFTALTVKPEIISKRGTEWHGRRKGAVLRGKNVLGLGEVFAPSKQFHRSTAFLKKNST